MRTTIDVDDRLMREAMKLRGAKSKRETVETALRELAKHRKATRAIKELRGKIEWNGNLDAMRRET